MRGWVRVVMAAVGVVVFLVYALAAVGGYLLLTWLVADPPNLAVALGMVLVFTLVAAYVSYRFGTTRMLAALEATELPPNRAPSLYRRLDRLCREMDGSRPPVLVGDLGAPNALSLGGPREGVVVLDRRLLTLLMVDELEEILAHELAHMERYDTFLQTLAVSLLRTLVGLVTLLFLPVLPLLKGLDRGIAWIRGRPADRPGGLTAMTQWAIQALVGSHLGIVTLLLFAHSRRREYAADRRAVEVTGNPIALARALAEIHRAASPDQGLRSLLYIHGERNEDDSLRRLVSTHPPVDERIDRLIERAQRRTHNLHVQRLRP